MGKKFKIDTLVRADLKTLVPYNAPTYPGLIRLADNENPYDLPEEVLRKILQAAGTASFNRYPDTNAVLLREKLAAYSGIDQENIMVGNGSDELILAVMLAFGVGAAFAVAVPTFSMYSIHGQVAGAREIKIPRLADFSLDVPTLVRAAASPEVKLVILCNPNSPTGNATPLETLEEILANVNAVVVVDEAYWEFSGTNAGHLLNRYPNLVILRTFSKALSLAGLRVGYLLAAGPVLQELLKVKPPYNLNTFSQLAAMAVLDHLPIFQARVRVILARRKQLLDGLAAVPGVRVYPTETNFILFSTELPAGQVYDGLIRRGVLVRLPGEQVLSGTLRVTVGTERENMVFLTALREIVKNKQF